ncbi:hypothetical protein NDU88_006502 [Pleurodeles waltl]|uniref:Uncharacterized protein n=1 Tax=Pleurodeles waltl TaxID=8319 RepID=A0AAV7PIM4_PLEWA|nr:hypothetical protein NDU88_006502 [Pleurodeles waltl]
MLRGAVSLGINFHTICELCRCISRKHNINLATSDSPARETVSVVEPRRVVKRGKSVILSARTTVRARWAHALADFENRLRFNNTRYHYYNSVQFEQHALRFYSNAPIHAL